MKTPYTIRKFILFIIPLLFISFTIGDSKGEYNVPRKAFSVNTSDINLDGDMDIIVGHKTMWGETNKTISIMRNDFSGYFNNMDTSKSFCGYQENIFATKIDNDNYPDLITFYSDFSSGNAARYVRIYYNENGEFNNYTNFSLNSSETFTTINYGDVNGDGYHDLLVISSLGQFWGVLYNDGTGNFSSPWYYNVQDYYPSDIACADLNSDGREDIVVVGQKTEVFFSYSSGFQLLTLETNSFKGCVKIDDFDQNGTNDIATSLSLSPYDYTLLKLYNNLGNNNIVVQDSIIFQPLCFGDFNVSDFNNDSFPDLLFHPADNNNLLVFNNQENFQFGDSVFIPMTDYGETTRRSSCADFDGNGYNDIVTIRSWGTQLPANVNILFNDGNGNFLENPITDIQTSNFDYQSSNLTCYPNPFKMRTTIFYKVELSGLIRLQIFDLEGRLINTLLNEKMQKGEYGIKWNGTNNNRKEVKTGVYIIQLVTGRQNESCRIIYYR